MKRFIAAGILFVFVLAISITGSLSVRYYSDNLEHRLTKIQEAVKAEDYESAYNQSEDLLKFWESAEDVMAIFVNNAHINKIGASVEKIPSLCIPEEKGNILGECETIQYLMKHISEDERFSIYSVL